MSTENPLCITQKPTKTLYKLARENLFEKSYYCEYCGMIDFEKAWMKKHKETNHDEHGRVIPIFQCKKCLEILFKNKIITHLAQC